MLSCVKDTQFPVIQVGNCDCSLTPRSSTASFKGDSEQQVCTTVALTPVTKFCPGQISISVSVREQPSIKLPAGVTLYTDLPPASLFFLVNPATALCIQAFYKQYLELPSPPLPLSSSSVSHHGSGTILLNPACTFYLSCF